MKDYKNIKTFEELIELEHGKLGTETRNKYEENAQMFIESEMLNKDVSLHSLYGSWESDQSADELSKELKQIRTFSR